MANTIEIVIQADNKASGQIKALVGDIGKQFESLGKKMAVGGLALGAAIAPAALGFKSAINSARQFDETMTDAQAILGATRDEMQALNAQVLDLGAKSVAGPQAAAAAFVEIAGGVSDASLHMSILEAAMKTAEAGAADLGATTSGLVAIMNSYGFSADQTSRVSDIMTRTVGMGVLTMDELAVAMPQVTSIAKTMGVTFEELGGSVAYLTAQGLSANVASTQLRATMVAMMKPTADMSRAFDELGVVSGEDLIDKFGGLQSAIEAVSGTAAYAEGGVGKLYGSVEAMNAVLALTGENAGKFLEEFETGIDGATEAAQKIQLESVNAQMALLKNQAEALKIEIGTMLLPVVNRIVGSITPVVASMRAWVRENPQVVKTIGMVTGALAGLAAALTTGGGAVALLGRTLPLLLNPVGLVIGALAALGVAYKENLLGFGDFVRDIAGRATDLANEVVSRFREGGFAAVGQWALEQIQAGLQAVIDWGTSVVSPIITDITTAFETGGLPAVGQLILDKIGEGITGVTDWATEHLVDPLISAITGKLKPGEKAEVEVSVVPRFDLSQYGDMPVFEGAAKINAITWAGQVNLETGAREMIPEVASEIVALLEQDLEEQLPGIDMGALLWTPKVKKDMETRTAEAMQDTNIVQKMLDGLGASAGDFTGFVNTNLVYPVVEKIQTTDWGAKINAVGDVLGKILKGIAAGAIDFGAWVLGDIMTPIANKLNDDALWSSVGSTLGEAAAKLVGGLAVINYITYKWAFDNLAKPAADAILSAVKDPVTVGNLILAGAQLGMKLGEGLMTMPWVIAKNFVEKFVSEIGAMLGITMQMSPPTAGEVQFYTSGSSMPKTGVDPLRAAEEAEIFGRDMGGTHSGRGPVWIGSGAQPELFWPNEAGTFHPAGSLGGGDTVNNWQVNLYGVQDMKQALDDLEREARRRNRQLTVATRGARS